MWLLGMARHCHIDGVESHPHHLWLLEKDLFRHCYVISRVMNRNCFECILHCLHCVDNRTFKTDKKNKGYNKIGKERWIIDSFVMWLRESWNPEKFVIGNEIMIAYRGHFNPVHQYIKAKPIRYGLKVWCLVSNSPVEFHLLHLQFASVSR